MEKFADSFNNNLLKDTAFKQTEINSTQDKDGYNHISKTLLKLDKNMINEKLATIFIYLGIPAHTMGYHYLREAIKLAAGNFEMLNCITTKLYPKVAILFNTNSSKVERCIRNSIEIGFNKGRMKNLNNLFEVTVCDEEYKPSSGEIIALLAEKLYIDGI